ncbi:MAG TPA: hypothetical protein DEQ85_04540, partial [Clostridiales bacterium]|nr:hypothetical protein [Clostridiales bacterium]
MEAKQRQEYPLSGCGKSRTLKCIAGIERPDSEKHIDLPPQKRRDGYLFQQYTLFSNMTVGQNIRCALRCLPLRMHRMAASCFISSCRWTVRRRLEAFCRFPSGKRRCFSINDTPM